MLLVIRPVSVGIGLIGARASRMQRGMMGWFGIRGIGSIYYLMFAARTACPPELTRTLAGLTFTTIAVSIVVHGVSVTPLMERYARRHGSAGAAAAPAER
jgi:NhaP-type Na+/H+ or K+/H+ antiporter